MDHSRRWVRVQSAMVQQEQQQRKKKKKQRVVQKEVVTYAIAKRAEVVPVFRCRAISKKPEVAVDDRKGWERRRKRRK